MPMPGWLFLRNLVERRSLLFHMVRRDFEQRFIGSAMGWVWGLIHPLVLLVSWWFVFQVCLQMPLPEGADTRNTHCGCLRACCPGCSSARPYSARHRAFWIRRT